MATMNEIAKQMSDRGVRSMQITFVNGKVNMLLYRSRSRHATSDQNDVETAWAALKPEIDAVVAAEKGST